MQILRFAAIFLGIMLFAAVWVYQAMAWWVTTEQQGQFYDGLGRKLEIVPGMFRLLAGGAQLWAGLWWKIVDLAVLFIGLGGVYGLGKLGQKAHRQS